MSTDDHTPELKNPTCSDDVRRIGTSEPDGMAYVEDQGTPKSVSGRTLPRNGSQMRSGIDTGSQISEGEGVDIMIRMELLESKVERRMENMMKVLENI